MRQHGGGPGHHIPAPTRERHVARVRTTHESSEGFEDVAAATTGSSDAATHEAVTDKVFGQQNIYEGGITLDKLRLQDEFATTILSPGGFLGSWEGFTNTGLYNGSFSDNRFNDTGVPMGRTEYIPYWTISQDVGTPVVQSAQGGVAILFTVASDKVTMVSDKVRVRQGVPIQVFINDYNSFSGSITRVVKIEEYGEGQTTPNVTKTVHTVTGGLGTFSSERGKVRFGSAVIPRGGANTSTPTTHIKIRIEITCATTTATYFVTEVGYVPVTRMMGSTTPTDNLEEQISDGLLWYDTGLREEYFFDEANDLWKQAHPWMCGVQFVSVNLPASGNQQGKFDSDLSNSGRIVMPYAGSIVAVSFRLSSNRTAGTFTCKPLINGVTVAPTVNITTATADGVVTQAEGTTDFAAGATLGVEFTTNAPATPVPQDVYAIIWIIFRKTFED